MLWDVKALRIPGKLARDLGVLIVSGRHEAGQLRDTGTAVVRVQ